MAPNLKNRRNKRKNEIASLQTKTNFDSNAKENKEGYGLWKNKILMT